MIKVYFHYKIKSSIYRVNSKNVLKKQSYINIKSILKVLKKLNIISEVIIARTRNFMISLLL